MYRLLHTGPHAPLTTMQYIQTQPPAMIITADGKDLANHLHVTTPAFAEGSYGKIYKGFLFQDAQVSVLAVGPLSVFSTALWSRRTCPVSSSSPRSSSIQEPSP